MGWPDFDRAVPCGGRALAGQFHDELAALVTGTIIGRRDAEQTSSQLELPLGRGLQFIRINGTVVGVGVGLALHAIVLAWPDQVCSRSAAGQQQHGSALSAASSASSAERSRRSA